jgi:hypothetical protein
MTDLMAGAERLVSATPVVKTGVIAMGRLGFDCLIGAAGGEMKTGKEARIRQQRKQSQHLRRVSPSAQANCEYPMPTGGLHHALQHHAAASTTESHARHGGWRVPIPAPCFRL